VTRLDTRLQLKLLAATPSFLQAAIVRATPRGLRARASPETFCLIEQACHLRDLEREGYAARLQRMLEESHPSLAGFEGDVVARERNYMVQDPRDAAAEFAIARAAFIARAEKLGEGELARTASFGGRTITIRDLLSMMVDHDEGHRREIAALVQLEERT
jgi:hypothetical protein